MISASGYVLTVDRARADMLLDHAAPGLPVGEPVPTFPLSRRAPLLVIASFSPGMITHLANGRKGVASGTRLVRLNLHDLHELAVPINYERLLEALPAASRRPVRRRLNEGGILPPASFAAVVNALQSLAPDCAAQLARFASGRNEVLERLTRVARDALAQQKESVGLALKLSGFDTRELLDWQPGPRGPTSFLDGLPGARVREDAMVVHDLGHVPGFDVVRDYPFAAKLYQSEKTRLTVILANKLPLEEQFGTDLIYFNETFNAFVMVQYKAMERRGKARPHFRLPNTQLDAEIERMDATARHLQSLPADPTCGGYRLSANPFYLKLCARLVFNPDDSGLFPGMYLPLDYWKTLVADPITLGPRGGRTVTFENVGRKFSENDFIGLVAGGWIGSSQPQSSHLADLVRQIIESGKAVTLASHSGPALRGYRQS